MVSAEDKFLQQLMAENEVQLKRKDSLDTRSFTMITISATSSALLIAVAVALLDKISSHYVFLDDIIIFLVIGIMLPVQYHEISRSGANQVPGERNRSLLRLLSF
jgi:multisubunit Na+/H+ antiporter MnhG subunit